MGKEKGKKKMAWFHGLIKKKELGRTNQKETI